MPTDEITKLIEENEMAGISTDTAGTLALLADTNRAGRGGGYWGGEGGGYGGYASPAANAVRLDANRDIYNAGQDRLALNLDNAQEERRNQNLCNRLSDSEFRTVDRLRDIEREMTANARVASECCCENKLAICELKSDLTAEIKAVESRAIQRELDAAQSELSQRNIIDTLSARCGCGCPSSS